MEDFVFLIISNFWIIFIVIIVVAFLLSKRRFMRIKRIFDNQALKRQGTIKGYFLNPILTFSYNDHDVRVSTHPGSKHQSPYTRVTTSIDNPQNEKMKVYSESLASRIGKKLGMQDIQKK